jgi:hypothetical protein
MARSDNGSQHISVSEIGSIAGAAFLSRTWQPAANNSASDGLTSFTFGLCSNAGLNVVREFLPDLTRHLFRHNDPTPDPGSHR